MTDLASQEKSASEILEAVRASAKMSEDDFMKKCLTDMLGGWVTMEMYLKLCPTETANAIYKRVQQGHWQQQVHYAAPRGGSAWINLPAVRLWITGELQRSLDVAKAGEKP